MAEKNKKQEKTWGMLCHLTALSQFIGIPFGHLIGPLVIWLIKKDEYPFVNEQGKASLNFQLSMTIYAIIAGILCLVVIGIFLLIAIAIADLVLIIIASVKVSNDEKFVYPFTIQFFK